MSSTAKRTFVTPEDYLARERLAEHKSEYYDGQVYAMAGASFRHNVIVMNLLGEIYAQLKGGPCQPCTGDVRLGSRGSNTYTYPDLMVVCGAPRFSDGEFDTLLNPTVIIEVLSPSTESWDRGGKFERYREIESLRDYVLVSQDRIAIEHHARWGDGWDLTTLDGHEATLSLPSIGCELALRDIYARVPMA